MDKAIRILLVDDYELVRYGLRHMLEQEEAMEIVGDYASSQEALLRMEELRPDIVLINAHMPGMNGIEAARSLKKTGLNYESNVIVLAESENHRVEAMVAGAVGYLLKDITRAELVQAIREICQGKRSDDERNSFDEEAIELIFPPHANAAQLLTFTYRLEESLNHESDSYISIARMVGSRDADTVITILARPPALANLLEKLENMPEVEKVEEEPQTKASPSLPRRYGNLLRPGTACSKRLHVTLKETSPARQGLAAFLK